MCISPLFRQWPQGFYSSWGQGLSFPDRFRKQEDGNPKRNKSVKLVFLQGFLPIFAHALSPPLSHPLFFSTSFKKEEIGKVCFSWFLKERSKNAREQKRRCAPAGRSLSAPWRTKQEGNKDKCECVQGAEKQAGGTCVRNCHSIAMPPQQTLRAGG